MQKEKLKTKMTVGVAAHSDPHHREITQKQNQKGITLIALIITIIVMLILVGVSVTVALNGGLFETAQNATAQTETEKQREETLAKGQIEINGQKYASYEAYLDNDPIVEWTDITNNTDDIPTDWKNADGTLKNMSIKVMTDGTNKIPLPEGYEISEINSERKVSNGLVIKDSLNNEFVWIPATDFETTYNNTLWGSDLSEPTTSSDDTQDNLNLYYGTKADESTNYYTLETNFDYSSHYTEMVSSVDTYGGFYIGRYETTIDTSGNIGSKGDTTVLTAYAILKEGSNSNCDDEPYYYRWWGLYDSQRNSNVAGNGDYVQTSMVWGQQWDAMIEYFDTLSLDYSGTSVSTLSTSSSVVNSGQAEYTYNEETINDKIFNIYDLRRNAFEWTAECFQRRLPSYSWR